MSCHFLTLEEIQDNLLFISKIGRGIAELDAAKGTSIGVAIATLKTSSFSIHPIHRGDVLIEIFNLFPARTDRALYNTLTQTYLFHQKRIQRTFHPTFIINKGMTINHCRLK